MSITRHWFRKFIAAFIHTTCSILFPICCFSAWCEKHFYGWTCDAYCKEDESIGQFTCDPKTGTKKCKTGWKGFNCHERESYFECHNLMVVLVNKTEGLSTHVIGSKVDFSRFNLSCSSCLLVYLPENMKKLFLKGVSEKR